MTNWNLNPGHSSISSQSFAKGWALVVRKMNMKKHRYFILKKKTNWNKNLFLIFGPYDFISYEVKVILGIRFSDGSQISLTSLPVSLDYLRLCYPSQHYMIQFIEQGPLNREWRTDDKHLKNQMIKSKNCWKCQNNFAWVHFIHSYI